MDYTLVRSDRRTLAVQITREGAVVVRAPRRLPLGEIQRFVDARAEWIEIHAAECRARSAAHPEPDEAARAALIGRARSYLPGRVAHYAAVMGLYPTGITITGARGRFGSCSPKNRLCFSWRLMRFPDAAVDYVVVHELAHIAQKNHGPGFHALVSSVLPDWKARRALLRE